MDSTLVPYLSTSGRGHGILYTNQGPKSTTLSYLDPSSVQIGSSAGQKDHGGFIHGTTIRGMSQTWNLNHENLLTRSDGKGGEKRAESRQAKPVKFVPVNFSPEAGEIIASRSTARAFSPIQNARHDSQPNCYDELDSLPYYVCEDLIDIWIGIIQPGMIYRAGSEPIWWPENIPFKRPQCLRKFGMSLCAYISTAFTETRKRSSTS